MAAEMFRKRGVGVSLTVTPCWCYGSETMDMDPHMPKAVWGFNGTERPGAVYLAAVLAAHTQKGLPAFGIYGRDVQDAGDTEIPDGCAGEAAAVRPGRPGRRADARQVVSLDGRRLDGHRRLDRRPALLRKVPRHARGSHRHDRVRPPHEQGIYDPDEFEKALAWVKANCPEGKDHNSPASPQPRAEGPGMGDSVKMTLIARDLMIGNPRAR